MSVQVCVQVFVCVQLCVCVQFCVCACRLGEDVAGECVGRGGGSCTIIIVQLYINYLGSCIIIIVRGEQDCCVCQGCQHAVAKEGPLCVL